MGKVNEDMCFACVFEKYHKDNYPDYPFPLEHVCLSENISMVEEMKGWSDFYNYNSYLIEKALVKGNMVL